jgi:Flp pilus assembly protein CpaB
LLRRWSTPARRYLAASIALAFVSGVLVHAYLSRAAAASGASGPPVGQVVAAGHVARGTKLTASQLRVERVPKAFAQPGSFGRISQVVGRVALVDLSAGEAVTKTRLARVRAGPVASLVPEGLRAFAVPTSLPPGAVVPGDRVDVLATYNSGQPHTETVADGLGVLFVLGASAQGSGAGGGSGFDAVDAAASGVAGSQVTLILLVAPDQEERLAFARAFADLAVAVAPP